MKEEFSDIQFPSNEESEETVDPESMLNLEGRMGYVENFSDTMYVAGLHLTIIGGSLLSEKWEIAKFGRDPFSFVNMLNAS